MRVVKMIQSSSVLSESEKLFLLHRVQPQIRWLLQREVTKELEQACVRSSRSWRYGLFEPKRTGGKMFLFWRNELQNFLYDLNLEPLDSDKDGVIFGVRYKKKNISPGDVADDSPLDPFDHSLRCLSHLGDRFQPIPVEALPKHLSLGQGVMSHFRPPRDSHYSLHVFAAKSPSFAMTNTTTTTSICSNEMEADSISHADHGANVPYSLPPFESQDFQFYSSTRNKIEEKFLTMENYVLNKVRNFFFSFFKAKNDIGSSSAVKKLKSFSEICVSLPRHITAAVVESKTDYFLDRPGRHENFWSPNYKPCNDTLQRSKRKLSMKLNSFEDLSEVIIAVRYQLLDETFIALRHLQQISIRDIPLVIPNPNPASDSSTKTFSTLRLARAEFVLFTTLIAIGAAPAIYRGLNFSFEHPMFAQSVVLSIAFTIAYTTWSSRRKIEMSANLLIEDATMARLLSQDSQTAYFIQQQYVDALTESLMHLYISKLINQRALLNSPCTDKLLEKELISAPVDEDDNMPASPQMEDKAYSKAISLQLMQVSADCCTEKVCELDQIQEILDQNYTGF